MYEKLAILAAFGLLYSIFACGIQRTWISGPIIFTVFGVLLGPLALKLISMESDPELLHEAPHTQPVRRLDEVRAAKQLDLAWSGTIE